jgi:very-short-patch-repair endonuclease
MLKLNTVELLKRQQTTNEKKKHLLQIHTRLAGSKNQQAQLLARYIVGFDLRWHTVL